MGEMVKCILKEIYHYFDELDRLFSSSSAQGRSDRVAAEASIQPRSINVPRQEQKEQPVKNRET